LARGAPALCGQREQLTESAFFAWRRTISERDAEAKPSRQPAFLPVVVDDHQRRHGAIAIELAGGRVLRENNGVRGEQRFLARMALD